MQVKSNEFAGRYAGLEVVSNNDSGLFAVQYSEQERLQQPRVTAFYEDTYRISAYSLELAVVPPTPRKVLRSLIVVKSSANCYRVGYADAIGAVQLVAKTYDELHAQLVPLWQRK